MNMIPVFIALVGGLLLISSGTVLILLRHQLWQRITNAGSGEKNPYGVGAVVMGLTLIAIGFAALAFFVVTAFFTPVVA